MKNLKKQQIGTIEKISEFMEVYKQVWSISRKRPWACVGSGYQLR